MDKTFLDYFRCPVDATELETAGDLSENQGYFAFGDALCFGRNSCGASVRHANASLPDVSHAVSSDGTRLRLPFDLSELVDNLRFERYRQSSRGLFQRMTAGSVTRSIYYSLRPLMSVAVRKHLQRIRLAGWKNISFPRWPVDASVEVLMQSAMAAILEHGGISEIPFIWFWPEGAPGCVMMTHDVEGPKGREFCGSLMDLDDASGIKSAFQVVPQPSSPAPNGFVTGLRARGFEVNLHDLSHDGSLFQDRQAFPQRAAQINRYVQDYQCAGFRSGSMYRQQEWYDSFDFSYDMSVPSVAHLEPQGGGCCTVMPYFVGDILELPLTTTQDYSLFHILGDYSIELWKQQIDLILSKNGLISFITHPDYLTSPRATSVYLDLLTWLRKLRAEKHLWVALPGEVNRWWRSRQLMTLVRHDNAWRVDGPESHRARLAYASFDNGRLVYRLADAH